MRIRLHAWGIIGLLGVAGCDVESRQGPAPEGATPPALSPSQVDRRGIEADFEAIGLEAPDFAGFYRTSNGDIEVRVVGGNDTRVTRDAVQRRMGGRLDLSGARVVGGAAFQIRELMAWRDAIQNDAQDGAALWTMLDVDEANNIVRVGVRDAGQVGTMRRRLSELGIPERAVVTQVEQGVPSRATLTDYVRPLVAGLETVQAGKLCSLGATVKFGSTKYLLTASHCTNARGSVSSGLARAMYQSSFKIGDEYADPAYFTGGACPVGDQCRYSDAARFALNIIPPTTSYAVARTTVQGTTGPGNTTIGANVPVTGSTAYPVFGDTLKKTGRTSGTTYGTVIATCASFVADSTNYRYLCQDKVAAYVDAGDSGSPVWHDNGTGATFYGILWGGTSTYFVFSNVQDLTTDLGSFAVN